MAITTTHQQDTALFVAAFFDEMVRWGVREVVVSPGSRSTALAMAAYELEQRRPQDLRVYVDIDERGAAFLGLGLAKASGRPVALVCTSGTALANYYPAVIEAETSRVPLIVLSGDRPPQLQGLGAPQTTDQLKAYGSHVRSFRAMPAPRGRDRDIAFARQAAREAVLAALGPTATLAPYREPAPAKEGLRESATTGVLEGADSAVAAASLGKHAAVSAGSGAAALPTDPAATVAMPAKSAIAGAPADAPARDAADDFAGAAAEEADSFQPIFYNEAGDIVNYNPNVQVASRACMHLAGPVQVNFPFDAPLKPDFPGADLQAMQRAARDCFALGARNADRAAKDGALLGLGPLVGPAGTLPQASVEAIERLLWKRPCLVLAGEGSCETVAEAEEILAWARKLSLPVLADPLSGLRAIDDALVIDNYDNLCGGADCPVPEVVIRFGRYPVSKSATALLERARPLALVVDVAETRDFNAATDVFVGTTPLGFVRSDWRAEGRKAQRRFADAWVALNDEARLRVLAVEWDGVTAHDSEATEGAYVRSLLELAPEGSCLFSANSMSIRAVDTFYVKDGKPLAVMANRGQNGIDGVVSTAVGVAQHFAQTTFLTGDFTMLHDLSGLALQRRDAAPAPRTRRDAVAGHRASEQQRRRHLRYAAPGFRRSLFRAAVPRSPGRALHRGRRCLRHSLGQRAHGRRLPQRLRAIPRHAGHQPHRGGPTPARRSRPLRSLPALGTAALKTAIPTKPPYVLLHGFAQAPATWGEVARRLQAAGHRTYAPDLYEGKGDLKLSSWEGAGESEKETEGGEGDTNAGGIAVAERDPLASLGAVCDRVAAIVRLVAQADGAPVLVGYSMGGRIAAETVVRHPNLPLAGLVLESAGLGPSDEAARATLAERNATWARRLREEGAAAFMDWWETLPLFATQRDLSSEVRVAIRAEREAHSAELLARSLEAWGAHHQAAEAATLSAVSDLARQGVPVLYVAGVLDEKYAAVAARAHAAGVPVVLVPNVGHNVHLESPSAFGGIAEGVLAEGGFVEGALA